MTTFRLARSPTASIAGAVRSLASLGYTAPPVGGGGLPAWLKFYTQIDEQLMYDNVLNWTWTAADKTTTFAATPPSYLATYGHSGSGGINGDVHDGSEGDDLWQHYVQYLRTKDSNPTAANIHKAWAQAWRNYFVTSVGGPGYTRYEAGAGSMGSAADTGVSNPKPCTTYGDHMYGTGLVLWGVLENDQAAKDMAVHLLTTVEATGLAAVPGTTSMGGRKWARWLQLACYVSMIDPSTRWINLRDHIIDCFMGVLGYSHPGSSTSPPVIGGLYLEGRPIGTASAGGWTNVQFDAGFRWSHSMYTGMTTEALWLAYKLTNRSDVRDRLIEMARYTLHYAWDSMHANPMCGARWGHRPVSGTGSDPTVGRNTAGFLHQYSDEFGATAGVPLDPPPVMNTDPNLSSTDNYESSLVSGLVYAYKLTGEQPFLDRAFAHLRQATCYANATGTNTKLPQDEVRKYLDTERNVDLIYFNFNKGMLQYSYAICENGGVPAVESAWPPYQVPANPGQVIKIGAGLNGDPVPNSATVTHTGGDNSPSTYPTNVFADVRPLEIGGITKGMEMLTGGDTRTKFIESYSRGGAIVIAGSGGHKGTTCWGAALFDFEDARWKRVWTTQGNPPFDNTTNEGPPPSQGGPPFADARSGTLIHGCPNHEDDLIEAYSANTPTTHAYSGMCWNDDHWSTHGGTTIGGGSNSEQRGYVPIQADPRNQHWEVSMLEPAAYVPGLPMSDARTHGYKYPGEWGGFLGGRFTHAGYVMPSFPGSTRNPPLNPIPAGTLEPTQSEIPAPAHIWDHYYEMKPSEGGGPRGSICTGRHFNIGDIGVTSNPWSHRFDLHTGIWHRFGVNSPLGSATVPAPGGGPAQQPDAHASAEDPVTRRGFLIAKELEDSDGRVNYINISDRTWRNFAVDNGVGGGQTPGAGVDTKYMVVDPDRRLLIVVAVNSPHLVAVDLQTLGQTGTPEPTPSHALGGWRVIPYDDIPGVQSVPPFVNSTTAASAFPHGMVDTQPWRYYPPLGKFYRVSPYYVGGGFQSPLPADLSYQITVLQRLTPPPIIATPRPNFYYTTEALSGRWTLDEITLETPLPVPDSGVGYAACGFSLMHYVPSLQCLAFAPLDHSSLSGRSSSVRRCVYLIKPY